MKTILIQTDDFDIEAYRHTVEGNLKIGAEVSFVGRVREFSERSNVIALSLEHYPGMTENALDSLADEAIERWQLEGVVLVHRVGYLKAGDNIVLVMVYASHRSVAFEACEFLIDRLKTEVPLWKKEHFKHGERWVDERHKDHYASQRWESK